MPATRLPIYKRIIFWMIVPVMLVGIAVSVGLNAYLSPPMIAYLAEHIETNLKLASNLGLNICEGYFSDLLNMRLEDNPEMNKSMQYQALEEIKSLKSQLPPVQMIVIEGNGTVRGSSLELTGLDLGQIKHLTGKESIVDLTISQSPAKARIRYFPFWDWTIISFVFEKDYQAPVSTAKTIVYLSTIGVFIAVMVTLTFVFHRLVNRPLNRLIRATEAVIDGNLLKVEQKEINELGRLIASFNNMVESLEREKAEVRHLLGELRQSENRFRTMFDYTPVGICVALSDGLILETNDSLRQMIGFSKEELKQKRIAELFYSKYEAEKICREVRRESKVMLYQTALLRTDNSICQARITVSMLQLDGQEAMIAMVEDITNQKKLEGQLQRAQKMEAVGTLAGGVAHDLNNILSGLVSYPELLLMRLPEDSPLRKPVTTIQKSGLKAAAIVQDLLTLARRGVTTKEVVNYNDLIAEYFNSPEFERLKYYHPNVTIETDLSFNLYNIIGSTVHLNKTMMNLVSNAAEAIEQEGTIRVVTENLDLDTPIKGFEVVPKGKYAVLSVIDSGIGLPEDDKDKIFEPFYTKKKMGRSGTGLGMTVVWGTVKDHDGFINVISSPGQGTEIKLYFPASSEVLLGQTESVVLEQYLSKGETIMLVDDIAEQREMLKEILSELDYKVVLARSGEEAVNMLREKPVDLVILDMIMDPGMDGFETYKAILSIYPGQKAIIASGYSETDRVKDAEKLGVGCYIKKPFTVEEIGVAIRRELER